MRGDIHTDILAGSTLAPRVECCELDRGRPGALGRGEEIVGVGIEPDETVTLLGEVKQSVVRAGSDGDNGDNDGNEDGEDVHMGVSGKGNRNLAFAMSSHALLLRLFLSPAFFSLHIALKYLLLYADNIGITYYLAYRLRDLDVHELNDVWGFIW